MVLDSKAPIAVRHRLALAVLPLALLAAGGCKHHRSAMRPVYVPTAPISSPATCAPGFAPSEPPIDAQVDSTSTEPPVLGPIEGLSDSPVPPAAPARDRLEEPALEPAPSAAPELNGPSASIGRPSSVGRAREASVVKTRRTVLRSNLQAMVNDPADLFQPPKADKPWKYVVLHHSAHADGSLDQIDREHRKALGWDGCGYHFVIGNGSGSPDGQIEVARRWSSQKAGIHCRDARDPAASEYGIGICLIGDLDNAPPTPKQVAAAKALVAYLQDRYAIKPDRVESHDHLSRKATACPGQFFPADEIFGHTGTLARN